MECGTPLFSPTFTKATVSRPVARRPTFRQPTLRRPAKICWRCKGSRRCTDSPAQPPSAVSQPPSQGEARLRIPFGLLTSQLVRVQLGSTELSNPTGQARLA